MDLLKQLRDIHDPASIPIWPLAFGWYVLVLLVVGVMLAVIFLRYRYLQKQALKRSVLSRIQELELQQDITHLNPCEELSMLLKRCALAIAPRREVAALHGEKWLEFLDRTADTTEFSKGIGRALIIYPYKNKNDTLPAPFFHLLQEWVRKNL